MASLSLAFNFSCTVEFPDGSSGEVRQTDTLRDDRQGIWFFMSVGPQAKNWFTVVLHLSGSSLSNLDGCPGDTRAEQSGCVTDALVAWVKDNGLQPHLSLEVTVGYVDGQPCRVSVSPQ
jgi:hypothetical protein